MLDWFKDLWKGCKIFSKDIKHGYYLSMKRVEGFELNHNESIKLSRARSDTVKFIPFILLCLIPGTCLLLPICLVAFPNMLPSSFETIEHRHNKHYRTFVIRSRISEPLQNEYKKLIEINVQNKQIKEMIENRSYLENNELIKAKKYYIKNIDKVMIKNMNFVQLVALSKYLKMFSFYPQFLLRLRLIRKMNIIKNDDRLIENQGIESLTKRDLEDVCEDRGIKYEGLDKEEIRNLVKNWIDLSVNHSLPVSYLFFYKL